MMALRMMALRMMALLPTPSPSLPAGRGVSLIRQNTVDLLIRHGGDFPLPFQGRGWEWVDWLRTCFTDFSEWAQYCSLTGNNFP